MARNGQTIGYFIPTHGQAEADIASLKKASNTSDRLLEPKTVQVDARSDRRMQNCSQTTKQTQETRPRGGMSNTVIALDANILFCAVLEALESIAQEKAKSVGRIPQHALKELRCKR